MRLRDEFLWLQQLPGGPCLAEITRSYFNCANRYSRDYLEQAYDKEFSNRPDWIYWRLAFDRSRPPPMGIGRSPAKIVEFAIRALSTPAEALYSALAAVTLFVDGRAPLQADYQVPCELKNRVLAELDVRLTNLPRPHIASSRNAAVVSAFARHVVMQRKFAPELSPPAIACIRQYLDQVHVYLSDIDGSWRPGMSLRLAGLESERPVWPLYWPNPKARVASLLRRVLSGSVALGNRVLAKSEYEPALDDLLLTLSDLAVTDWQMAKSYLRSVLLSRKCHPRMKQQAEYCHAFALWHAVQASRDADRVLAAARYLCRLLWTVPEDLKYKFRSAWRKHGWLLTQVGLMIPAPLDLQVATETTITNTADAGSMASAVRPNQLVRPKTLKDSGSVGRVSPNAAWMDTKRLAYWVKHDPRWKALQVACPSESPTVLLKSFVESAVRGNHSPELLHEAFDIALERWQLIAAAQLLSLKGFCPRPPHVVSFAEAVSAALQVAPLLANFEAHRRWNLIVRRAWARARTENVFSRSDVFTLHENVLGATVRSAAGLPHGRAFLDRYFNKVSQGDFRELVNTSNSRNSRARSSISSTTASADSRVLQWRGGSMAAVSVVCVEEPEWSILATGPDPTRCIETPFTREGLLREAVRVSDSIAVQAPSVFWTAGLTELGRAILHAVVQVNPDTTWIALAIEPRLAKLPWQAMMRALAPTMIGREILITIVPNRSWIHDRINRGFGGARGVYWSVAHSADFLKSASPDGDALKRFHDTICAQKSMIQDKYASGSVAILVGHGSNRKRSEGHFPTVNGHVSFDEVDSEALKIGEFAHTLMHSCWTGRTRLEGGGDLGGWPFILLSLHCRFFCAPVARVHPDVAEHLHHHLLIKDGTGSLGERYLDAMKTDPRVAVYNVYGLPCEPSPRLSH